MTAPRVPRLHVGLAGLQFALALLALGLGLTRACGSCSRGGDVHLMVAGVGSAAYLALVFLGVQGHARLFSTGVFLAGGVHMALGISMVLGAIFCPTCAASLGVALLLMVLVQKSLPEDLRLLGRAFLPALLVTGAGMLGPWAKEESRGVERSRVTRVRSAEPPALTRAASLGPVHVTVYEKTDCGYCRDFREFYSPRLEQDFGPAVEITFLPAERASWVERTPTIAIEGGNVFEGLPRTYEDLHDAVAQTRRVLGAR
jgi:hypothetical protein